MPARRLAVASLSARWLAESAQRSGQRAVALDLFGDVDTRRAAVAWYRIGEPGTMRIDIDALRQILRRLYRAGRIDGWVTGAGFDGLASAWSQAPQCPPLIGNAAETVVAVREPARFFALLDSLGLPHPAISLTSPAQPEGWLRKDAAGSGGLHIRRMQNADRAQARGIYYQRECVGQSLSALFAADRHRARVIAFSEQFLEPLGESPYVFCGALGPITLPAPTAALLREAIDALVDRTGLIGLNSLDFLWDGERFNLLEINPRPSATLALYDVCGSGSCASLLQMHAELCSGAMPLDRTSHLMSSAATEITRGARIVFATTDRLITAAASALLAAVAWIHDIPSPNTVVARGEPLCTVSAVDTDSDAVRACLARRAQRVLSMTEKRRDVESCPSG